MMIIVSIGNGCAVSSALVSIEAFNQLFVKLICSIRIRVYTSPEIIRRPYPLDGFLVSLVLRRLFLTWLAEEGKPSLGFG
ncbi:uncharacterized protein METZ01_LOCUS45453 [marine metagenome]|jgi:hypothetical protein|uniref:Uncharacterized protein n=1 Tax=marine metagenome TaxID=408172 RepID=A0A381RNJ7_9ZZZZ